MSWSDRSYSDEGPIYRGGGGGGGWRRLGPTAWLAIVNIVLFVLLILFGGLRGSVYGTAVEWLSFRADLGVSTLLQVWRPFTYQFMHGDPMHLFFNMILLWCSGRMLEEVYSPRAIILLYLGFGIVGAMAFLIEGLVTGHGGYMIGASASAIGLAVLMGFTFPRRQIIFIIIPMSCAVFAAILVGLDVLWLLSAGSATGTAHSAHLGGAFAAFAVAWIWPRLRGRIEDGQRDLERRRQKKADATRARDEAEMDRILEKINQEGMPGLTDSERDFLKRQSERLRKR